MAKAKEKKVGIVERFGRMLPESNLLFLILIAILIVVSFVLQGTYTKVGSGEQYVVTNLISLDGFRWILYNIINNFRAYPPLGIVIVGVIGFGFAEKVGLLGTLIKKVGHSTPEMFILPVIVFIGINSSVASDAGYIVLIPLAGALYAGLGRNPLVGIAAAFAAVSAGFGAALIPTPGDGLLGTITEGVAADAGIPLKYNPVTMNYIFMIASTFFLTALITFVTKKYVEKRADHHEVVIPEEGRIDIGELNSNEKKGLKSAGVAFAAVMIVLVTLYITGPLKNYDVETVTDVRDGTYLAKGEETEDGWRQYIEFTIVNGSITAVDYDALNVQDDDSRTMSARAIDGDYTLEDASAPTIDTQFAAIEEYVLAGNDVSAIQFDDEGMSDEISGVTVPYAELTELFEDAYDNVPAPKDGEFKVTTPVTKKPLLDNIIIIMIAIFLFPSIAYGRAVKKINSGKEYIQLTTLAMKDMAYIMVFAIFAGNFLAIFSHSGLSDYIANNGAQLLIDLNIQNDIVLLMAFIALCAVINLFMGSASAKWTLLAPIFVVMLNTTSSTLTPEIVQAAYRVADSSTNIISPLMTYMGVILIAAKKFVPKFEVGDLMAIMMPYSIAIFIGWSAFFALWMLFGLPFGI